MAFPPPDFNCTIQELKLVILNRVVDHLLIFQLHHTGIKTPRMPR